MLQQDGANPLPFFFVGKAITNERILRFKNTKHKLLSDAIGKTDTKAVWYTKEHISHLLEEMNKVDADGLRIYFGSYGEKEQFGGQLCLLMVMTKAEGNSHKDITIEDSNDFKARSIDDMQSRDFNVGSPCPPICDDDGMEFPKEGVS